MDSEKSPKNYFVLVPTLIFILFDIVSVLQLMGSNELGDLFLLPYQIVIGLIPFAFLVTGFFRAIRKKDRLYFYMALFTMFVLIPIPLLLLLNWPKGFH